MSATETEVTPVEALEPKAKYVEVSLKTERGDLTLTMKPLSFFGKLQLVDALSVAMDKCLTDGTVTVSEIMAASKAGGEEGEIWTSDVFVRLLLKLTSESEELIGTVYCIGLGVPKNQHDYVRGLMSRTEEEGGLSDAKGVELLEAFIESNFEVLKAFFVDRILPLLERISK